MDYVGAKESGLPMMSHLLKTYCKKPMPLYVLLIESIFYLVLLSNIDFSVDCCFAEFSGVLYFL